MPRGYTRHPRRWVLSILALAVLLVMQYLFPAQHSASVDPLPEGTHRVERVVDGDTLLMEGGVRVRLQGIDAPETVKPDAPVEPWGPEASQYTRTFVAEAGGQVGLTYSNERLDQYGRHLAFVWNGERLLNEELVREGLAHARLGYRYSDTMKRRLAAAQDEARRTRRGIWSEPQPQP